MENVFPYNWGLYGEAGSRAADFVGDFISTAACYYFFSKGIATKTAKNENWHFIIILCFLRNDIIYFFLNYGVIYIFSINLDPLCNFSC